MARKRSRPAAINGEPRNETSSLEASSVENANPVLEAGQAPRSRGRPAGAKPFHERPVRFDLALLAVLERHAPNLEPALAADVAASLASPRAKPELEIFPDEIGCVRIGFQGLRERGKYLRKLYSAEISRLSPEDAAWIDVSARRLVTMCRAIARCGSDPARREVFTLIAFSELAALAALGWAPTLVSIAARMGDAPMTWPSAPVGAEGEHLAGIAMQLSAKKSAPEFNSPPFGVSPRVPSPSPTTNVNQTDATMDLLYGLGKIAAFVNMTVGQVQHLHRSGDLPTFKLRKKVCARKSTLEHWLAEREAAGRGLAQ